MISIYFIFYVMVAFFAIVGSMRGWQKEVIAMTSMIAAMAILANFGYAIMSSLANALPDTILGSNNEQQIIWLEIIFYLLFAFFGYQVVGAVTGSRFGGRWGERIRNTMERRFIGAILGAINGFMLIGGLWGFLEYQLTPNGYVKLPPNVGYPFNPNMITRPVAEATQFAFDVTNYLPESLAPITWLILFFLAFFFVLVALL